MRPKFEDIKIGNRIYFNSKTQTNYDLYWTVKGKLNSEYILVEINENGANNNATIHIPEVYRLKGFKKNLETG